MTGYRAYHFVQLRLLATHLLFYFGETLVHLVKLLVPFLELSVYFVEPFVYTWEQPCQTSKEATAEFTWALRSSCLKELSMHRLTAISHQ